MSEDRSQVTVEVWSNRWLGSLSKVLTTMTMNRNVGGSAAQDW